MTTTDGEPQAPLVQASAVPYRRGERGWELCLITSLSSGRWGFPKGLVDPGETSRETALKESHEEAGLVGTLHPEPLGQYRYAKWGRMLDVTVYLMEVTGCQDEWLEAAARQRRWVAIERAGDLIDRRYLRTFVRLARQRLQAHEPA